MPSLGPLEILVIFIVALLVFGPNKLPELARQVGKGLAEFRKVQHHLKGELDDAIHSVMDDDKPNVAPRAPVPPATDPVTVDSIDVPSIDGPSIDGPSIDGPASETPAADPASTTDPARVDPGPTPPPLADDA